MAYTVHCPSCSTEFPVDPDKVPREGVNARCSSCAEVFFVGKPTGEGEEGGVAAPASPVEVPQEEGLGFEEPTLDVEEEAEEEAWAEVEEAAEEDTEAEVEEPAFAESPDAAPPGFSSETAAADAPEISEDDFVLEQETLYTEEAEAPFEEADTGLELEAPSGEAGAPVEEAPPEEAPPEELTVEEEAPSGEAPAALGGSGEAAAPAGPVQFGQRSPEDKAQRLARVLVSDMILYNPQRHTRAMENDSLAEEFEDEIKKSWEEYVEQVGEELAENTSYFTEALNEILAKGEEIF